MTMTSPSHAVGSPHASEGPDPSDERLLLACRQGEPGAFAELYLRYGADARRYARTLVGTDDVDDVVAESFAKLLRALRAGKGPVDHPIRYLVVTVRTTAATLHGRRAKADRTVRRLRPPTDPTAQAFTISDEELVAAFRTLSGRWRQVIWWTEIEGLSHAEVGQRLGISPGAASGLAYRARRALRLAYLREQRRTLRIATRA